MLWHGTPNKNILSILQKGLRITPADDAQHGRRFGNGIYFSDSFNLSNCYCSRGNLLGFYSLGDSTDYYGNNGDHYILLCEVATGNTAHILHGIGQEITNKEGIDCVRIMSSQGQSWDSELLYKGVSYPIGQSITYEQPIITKGADKTFNNYTPFQSHLRSKMKVQPISKKKIDGLSSSDSDVEMEIESEEEVEKVGPGLTKAQKENNSLVILRGDREALYPNEVTAGIRQMVKNQRNWNLSYNNYNNEYIIYDKALVRVRYILQLRNK